MPTMLNGLNKIPPIWFMAACATLLLSVFDPKTHSEDYLRVRAKARVRARVTEVVEPVLVL